MAEITDVRIYKVEGTGNLRAYAAITVDDAYVVHGLRVLEGEAGLWVGMPASKNKRGEFKDIFHPITKEAREVLVNSVISKYEDESGAQAPSTSEEKPAEETPETTEAETPETSDTSETPEAETPEEKVEE